MVEPAVASRTSLEVGDLRVLHENSLFGSELPAGPMFRSFQAVTGYTEALFSGM